MNKQLSDEQLDELMRTLVNSSAINETELDEIASSPTLWWSVQREIAGQNAAVASPWPPTFNWLRAIGFAVSLLLLAVVAIGLLNFRPANESAETAGLQQNEGLPVSEIATVPPAEPAAPSLDQNLVKNKTSAVVITPKRSRSAIQNYASRTIAATQPKPADIKDEEVKSEFIALSYAQNPSSGQIVRVKVPSSMKVTLGMVDRVDKPGELVDAEVVVGDDGMTHAIRFIRQ